MLAYRYDEETKYYIEPQECQLDPLETEIVGHDIWLLPANCTWKEPLKEKDGYYVKWNDGKWEYEKIPAKEEPKSYEPTEEEIKAQKIAELKAELASTDYKCLKYVDGALSAEEYAEIKAYRAELRRKINGLEGK